MQFLALPLLLASAPLAFAQYGGGGGGAANAKTTTSSTSAPASTTASGSSSVQTVNVGQNGFSFSPNILTADVGSTIEFHFFPPGHSVSQSNFANPCVPINDTAFFSGEVDVASGESSNVFTLTINDTNPIWFYCSIPGHCEAGMAGVINTPSDTSTNLAAYQSAAATATTIPPPRVQGGILGAPVKAAASPSGSGSSSASPSASASSSSSGSSSGASESFGRVGVAWVAAVVLGAAGVGGLMM